MRCLYCGNQLALLKKLTGSGEFCSEAHRQSYQEEYNRLALSRLLQTQSSGPDAAAKPMRPARTSPAGNAPGVEIPTPIEAASQVAAASPVEAGLSTAALSPAAIPVAEPAAIGLPSPPEAGFLRIELSPTLSVGQHAFSDEPLARESGVAMPVWTLASGPMALATAEAVSIKVVERISEGPPRSKEKRLEGRDFTRSVPAVEPRLEALQGRGLGVIKEPIEISVSPVPPRGEAPYWQMDGMDVEIEPCFTETARLELSVLGLEPPVKAIEEPGVEKREPPPAEMAETPAPPPAAAPAFSEFELWERGFRPAEPIATASPVEAHTPVLRVVEAHGPATISPRSALQDLAKLQRGIAESFPPAAEAPAETPEIAAAAEPNPAPAPVEEPATPGRMTAIVPPPLKGIPAGKGKLVQSFQAITATSLRINLPRVISLPLRPKITIGPAPAEPKFSPKMAESKTAAQASDAETQAAVKAASIPETRPAEPKDEASPAGTRAVETKEPERKQKLDPERAMPPETTVKESDAGRLRPMAETTFEGPHLGIDLSGMGSPIGGFLKRLPPAVKAAALVVAVGMLSIVGWEMKGTGGSRADASASGDGIGPSLAMGEGGWSTDWAADGAGSQRGGQISIYRPSLNMTDYRLEFQGEIESKSIGWIFRASNPRNYYAMKLETIKPGLSPTVVLVKYAVVGGEDQARRQIPLPMPVRLDTVYKVRLDVRGATFTTSVGDQVVDVWTDKQLKTGGVGFFSEPGERAQISGVQISVLSRLE